MGAPSAVQPNVPPSPCLASALYRLTVRQYDRIRVDGTIEEGERVELIEGLLVVQKRTESSRHRGRQQGSPDPLADRAARLARGQGGSDRRVGLEQAEPDLAVIRGVVEDYDERSVTAEDVALVVEIADSRLPADRTDLTRVYAAAGIPVYWIVNLAEGQVEIWFDPRREGYQSQQVLGHRPGRAGRGRGGRGRLDRRGHVLP